jgi:hypothetical protein
MTHSSLLRSAGPGSSPGGPTLPLKRCPRCDTSKPYADFAKCSRSPSGLRRWCRGCNNAYNREWYRRPEVKPGVRLRQGAHFKATVLRNKLFVCRYLNEHPCVDCGEADPIVLEFDHIRGDKIAPVARLVVAPRSLSVIEKEIAKCVVRCANCHRRKTYRERGYYSKTLEAVAQRKLEHRASTSKVRGSSPRSLVNGEPQCNPNELPNASGLRLGM